MFGILDRYVGRSVLMAILLCTLMLVGLSALIKYVEQMKHVGSGSYDAITAGWYVLYTIPKELVLFFPIGALLGGVIGLGQLASSSELVVLQSVGRSRFNIVMAVLKTVLPVMVVVMLLGEYLAPITERRADDLKSMAVSGGQMTVSSAGVWIREQQDFINIAAMLRDGTLQGITRYRFGTGPDLLETAQAERGHLCDRCARAPADVGQPVAQAAAQPRAHASHQHDQRPGQQREDRERADDADQHRRAQRRRARLPPQQRAQAGHHGQH